MVNEVAGITFTADSRDVRAAYLDRARRAGEAGPVRASSTMRSECSAREVQIFCPLTT